MQRRFVIAAWLCFLVRAAFYSYLIPVWEGYDEWAHYAFIEHLSHYGSLPDPERDRVSREVAESLHLLPLSYELRGWGGDYLTHENYWRDESRARRETRVRELPGAEGAQASPDGPLIYEGLQPPLYYWISVPVMRLARGVSLPARVLWLRWWSVLLASAAIPLTWMVAQTFLTPTAAIAAALIAAAMPEWLIDASRISNEALGVPLFACVILLALRLLRRPEHRATAVALGLALGFGLLTKAYFLAAIPPVLLLIFFSDRRRALAVNITMAVGTAALVSGWWFFRNIALGRTVSGLSEAVTIRDMTLGQQLAQVPSVPWLRAADAILLSHIWYGGWSGLGLRSWMYHLFYAIVGIAAVGLLLRLRREWRSPLGVVTLFFVLFALAQAYNVLLLYLSKGAATSMGWYMYAVLAAEVPLVCAGLPGDLTVCLGLFAALDLYTVHFLLIPYYTGLTAHRGGGAVQAFHWSQLQQTNLTEIVWRLTVNRGSGTILLALLWTGYLVATAGLVWAGCASACGSRHHRGNRGLFGK